MSGKKNRVLEGRLLLEMLRKGVLLAWKFYRMKMG
jgi:hypothetical protein